MEIQSLSLCVPVKGGKCVNNCKYCLVSTHTNPYENLIEKNGGNSLYYEREYRKRLAFARDNGCNTVILTGAYEPLQNIKFIEKFFNWNNQLTNPFRWVELQTVGNLLTEKKIEHLRALGINTISISVANLFDDKRNAEIIGMPQLKTIDEICKLVTDNDLNLRISLNLTSDFEGITFDQIIEKAKKLKANQITFRKLYVGNEWTVKNSLSDFNIINQYLDVLKDRKYKKIEKLPFGAISYDVSDVSVVIDDDCMASKEDVSTLKYLILRENCKLYSKWDTPASLKF
jgi:sulfatase maturation enzyme AslB (radical SAM superfamily)